MRADGVVWRVRLPFGDHGIELSLYLLFVLTLVVVTWLLALGVFPQLFPGWPPAT